MKQSTKLLVAALAVAAAGVLVEASLGGRHLTQAATGGAPMPNTPKCQPLANVTAPPPPSVTRVWTVQSAGTRNYTCSGGMPVALGAVGNLTGEQMGRFYYLPSEPSENAGLVGYFIFDVGTAMYWGDTLKNITYPAPNGILSYAQWPVVRESGQPHCDYITRTNTTGGATPTSCGPTPQGGSITVPFTATYTCYACA